MLKKVEGIIFRTIKYSETSIICDIYTLELGLRTYIISGVRKKNAKVSPALVRPMSLVEMVVYHHEEKEINRIKEIKASYLYQQLPFNVAKGAVGLFIIEVAQKAIKEAAPNTSIYHFLSDSYQLLDQTTKSVANFSVWFLVQFLNQIGLRPPLDKLGDSLIFDYAASKLVEQAPSHSYYWSDEEVHLVAGLQQLDFDTSTQISLTTEQKRNLVAKILNYYQYHIANFGELKSLVVLQEVFQ